MKCRVCGKYELLQLYILNNYPFTAGQVTGEKETIATCDLILGYCFNCGMASLLNKEVDSLVYNNDYTSSNIVYGTLPNMDMLTDRFIKYIGNVYKPRGSKVLEIGCYDGSLMGLLSKRYGYDVIGCETCVEVAGIAQSRGYDVQVKAFNSDDYIDLDMVVARNVLEHIPYPDDFVKQVSLTLNKTGAFVLEIPDGEYCIGNGILGTIVPEHPCYYGVESLTHLLERYFQEVQVSKSGVVLCAIASKPRSNISDIKIDNGFKERFSWFISGGTLRMARLDKIKKVVGAGDIGLFGANTCALELLSSGSIQEAQIIGVYDDDSRRWGKYLVNTNLVVKPRIEVLKSKRVIVCSYTHRKSIAEYLKNNNVEAITLYEGEK